MTSTGSSWKSPVGSLALLAILVAGGPAWAEEWVVDGCPLKFEVQPEGAFVVLDGKEIGKAPVGDFECPAVGTHSVIVQKEGYYSATRTFAFWGGLAHRIEIVLVEKEGHGKIVVSGSEMTLFVDGWNEDLTPWEGGVEVGKHTIKITSGDEVVKVETVTVGEGKTAHVVAEKISNVEEEKKLHSGFQAVSGGSTVGFGAVMIALQKPGVVDAMIDCGLGTLSAGSVLFSIFITPAGKTELAYTRPSLPIGLTRCFRSAIANRTIPTAKAGTQFSLMFNFPGTTPQVEAQPGHYYVTFTPEYRNKRKLAIALISGSIILTVIVGVVVGVVMGSMAIDVLSQF